MRLWAWHLRGCSSAPGGAPDSCAQPTPHLRRMPRVPRGSNTWGEVKVAGARPRARCCTALFALEQRVLMFGGDTYGARGWAGGTDVPVQDPVALACSGCQLCEQ